MSHTSGNILLHFIFSTRERRPLIRAEFRDDLFAYLGGIIRDMNGTALIINGANDHVHMLIRTRPVHSAAEIARIVKTNSSRWIREKHAPDFAWQTGYAVFSVSESNIDSVTKYIAGQEEHHKTRSFQEEYVAFLKKNHVEYDPQIYLGLMRYPHAVGSSMRVSFAPPGLRSIFRTTPTACAVGCRLSPLRG